MAVTPRSPQVSIRCVCSEPRTRRNEGEKENGWGQAPPKDGRSLSRLEPGQLWSPGSGPRDPPRGRSSPRPSSRVQMTGQGPRAAARCHQHGLWLLSTGWVPDGQRDPFLPRPAAGNVAVGARKSSSFPRGRLTARGCPGFTTEALGATGDWRSRGGHGVPQSSKRAPHGRWLRKRDALWACVGMRDSVPSPVAADGYCGAGRATRCLFSCPGRFRPGAEPGFGVSLSPGLPHPLGGLHTPWLAGPTSNNCRLALAPERWERKGRGRTWLLLRPDPTPSDHSPVPAGVRLREPGCWGQILARSLTGCVILGTLRPHSGPQRLICKTGVFTACLRPRAVAKVT